MIQPRILLVVVTLPIMAAASVGAGTMYATNDSNDSFYRLDLTTGTGILIGPSGVVLSFTGLAFDTSTGTMYVSDAYDHPINGLGIVDLSTGVVNMVGSHVNSNNIHGLAYDSVNDVLYGSDTMPCGGLAVVDRSTGESACIGPYVVTTGISGLAFDPATDTLYGIDEDSLYVIDRASGAATLIGAHGMAVFVNVIGLELDSDTGTLYGATQDRLYTIDSATGVATLLADGISNPNPSGLASVPSRPIFSDGFESGDTTRWSAITP